LNEIERIGGEEGLERLIRLFVDRVFADFIIGYQFEGRDKERIVRHETEFASAHLGGVQVYAGRPLVSAHRPLKINRGHFRRRLAILRTVLSEQGIAEDVIERWVAFERQFERAITDGTDCVREP